MAHNQIQLKFMSHSSRNSNLCVGFQLLFQHILYIQVNWHLGNLVTTGVYSFHHYVTHCLLSLLCFPLTQKSIKACHFEEVPHF